ncbi:hypothetical protein BSKO_08454 [Bryopsis sp. KO-2023]|nr:hypothetical protein BSKO_08454 [Bryopsis sp. KO-2023]
MDPSSVGNPPAPPVFDHWLGYAREKDEAAFVRNQAPVWTQWDRIIFCFAIFSGPSKVSNFASPSSFHTILHHVWYLFTTVCCPLTFLGMMVCNSARYNANRQRMMSLFRMLVVIGGGVTFFVHDPVQLWVPKLLVMRLFSHTPVCSLFFTALHRLPFRRHFWVHLVGALLSTVWVMNLCDACNASPEVDHAVNRLGWVTEGILVRATALGFPVKRDPLQPGQYSCWLVGLFYHFWLGFFVPSVAVYISELVSRLMFCSNLGQLGGVDELKNLKVPFRTKHEGGAVMLCCLTGHAMKGVDYCKTKLRGCYSSKRK